MTDKEKIKALEARIVELEAEILRLKNAQPVIVIDGSMEPFIKAVEC